MSLPHNYLPYDDLDRDVGLSYKIPTEEELLEIICRSLQLERAVQSLERDALRLPDQYYKLSWAKSQYARHRDRYISALAPIKKLPYEMLSEIFLHCVANVPATFPLQRTDMRLILCHVCAVWRHVALNEPRLWCNFRISSNYDWNKRNSLEKEWIERGKSCSVTMSFYTNRSRARAIDVGNIVAPVAGRLESLTLHSPITSRALRQLSDPPLRFPRLHTLYLDSKSRLDIIHTPYPSFPALSKLTLSHNKFVPHQEQFLWQNLVSLDMKSRVNARETVDVLRTCSSLKNCRLSIDEIQGTTAHFFRRLQRKSLPCLTSFHLRFYNETDYTCFLLPFTFPRLEDLSINFCHKFVCGWPQELKEYLSQRPWPQLQSFFVPYPSRSYIDNRIAPTTPLELEPEGIEFLSKFPTLFAVNFPDQTIISDKTLLDIGTGKLLPKLERLSIYAGEIDQILTMLETRNNPQQTGHNGCSKFKAVYLGACNLSISANAHKRIAALRKENLVVTIQHQDARKDTKWEKVVCPEGIPWVDK